MKVRILTKGFEKLTGYIGLIEFKDGVSVNDPSPLEINNVAASVALVDAETGEQLGAAAAIVTSRDEKAPVLKKLKTLEELEAEKAGTAGAPEPKMPENDGMPRIYSFEELATLADEGGIKVLREVAAVWEVKGKAINDLVLAVMKAQNKWLVSRGLPQIEFPQTEQQGIDPEADAKKSEPAGAE